MCKVVRLVKYVEDVIPFLYWYKSEVTLAVQIYTSRGFGLTKL